MPSRLCRSGITLALAVMVSGVQPAAQISGLDRSRAKQMARQIFDEIRKNYYDPTYGGRDLDAIQSAVTDRIEKATSLGQALGLIAQSLIDFNDSHLYFVPPARSTVVEYDWRLQMIGEACFIVAVRPGGDAARQDVAPGDRVLAIDGFPPRRSQLWKQLYNYRLLNPRTAVTLKLERGGLVRDVTIQSTIKQGRRSIDVEEDLDLIIREYENTAAADRHQKVTLDGVVVWKMTDFMFDPDDTLRWVGLDDARDVILDMRGNPGGATDTLAAVVGRLIHRPVTIAELKGRKPMKPYVSKKASRVFAGRVVALIDSRSGSAAELLARVLQLEKRGTVLGDRSSGRVRRAYAFDGKVGADPVVLFGAMVSDADVIMTDGTNLENVGVVPDEVILPTPLDLAAGRDPALARAAAILGVTIDPAKAGRLFPNEWK